MKGSQMKRILFLVDLYYPNPSPNVICVKRIMDNLKHDYEIYCITSDKNNYNSEYELMDGIHLYRTKKEWEYRFFPFCERKINEGLKIFKLIYFIAKCIRFAKNVLYTPVWPVGSINKIGRYYRKAEQLINEYQITQVVAVSYPMETFVAAKKLKMKFGDNISVVGYILDFVLLGRIGSGCVRKNLNSRAAMRLESHLIKSLDKTIIISSTQEIYEKIFGSIFNKKLAIADVPLISNKIIYSQHKEGYDSSQINIVYTGVIIKKERDPQILFELFNLLDDSMKKRITFNIYGRNYEYFAAWEDHQLRKYNIVLHGQVSEEVADNAVMNADILLNIGNDLKYALPSKTFKYISSQKPIIHLSPSNTDTCLPYLNKYPKAIIIDINYAKKNMLKCLELIKKALTNLDERQDQNCIDVEKMYPMGVPKYTADIIRDI